MTMCPSMVEQIDIPTIPWQWKWANYTQQMNHKEGWAPKNWYFRIVVLEKALERPLDCKRSNQSILREINPEYSLVGLMLKLKFRCFATWCEELTHLKRPWFWERLKAGGEGDDRGWDGWMTSPTRWAWVWVSSGNWWWTGKLGVLQSMGFRRVGHNWVTELISLHFSSLIPKMSKFTWAHLAPFFAHMRSLILTW